MIYYFMHNGPDIIRRAPYDEITHFMADSKYVIAYTPTAELVLDETLMELCGNHPELVYIHRSTVVKPDLVESLRIADGNHKYFAVLKSGLELKVSRRQYPKIREILQDRSRSAE